MQGFTLIVIGALMLATLGALALGLINMVRGGEGSAHRSNRLMMWRVTFQALAVLLLGLMFMTGNK